MSVNNKICIGGKLTLSDIKKLDRASVNVSISKNVLSKNIRSNKYLKEISKKKIIYGVNTGFGPMARTYIGPNKQQELQYNLIRSHAAGQGQMISTRFVKAMMLIRLHTLSQGFSGINTEVLILLKKLIEKEITPIIFEHGSVGASGDLVQLSHIALSLIGEGDVCVGGKIKQTSRALKDKGLKPITLNDRDGLALINGTSSMTAIASVNLIEAEKIIKMSISLSAFIYEIVGANKESISPIISLVRNHTGQKIVAETMTELLNGSKLTTNTIEYKIPNSLKSDTLNLDDVLQEIYSLRCAPQILGPILDTINNAKKVIETEINSVTDNPIISPGKGVFHSGNFHGDYVSLEMDKVRIAMTKLSLFMERQIHFLFKPDLNGKLPPFINTGTVGLTLGFQGLQFVATSNAAENQTLSTPISIHTIPTNNDNQDIVSMGSNSALLTAKVIENTYEIQAILFASVLQSINYLSIKNKLGTKTKDIYNDMEKMITLPKKDTPPYKYISKIVTKLKQYDIPT